MFLWCTCICSNALPVVPCPITLMKRNGIVLSCEVVYILFPVLQMVILYKDPRGEFIFNRGMSQMQITNTGMSLNDSEREKLRDLEVHCRDVENRLSKYEVNIVCINYM